MCKCVFDLFQYKKQQNSLENSRRKKSLKGYLYKFLNPHSYNYALQSIAEDSGQLILLKHQLLQLQVAIQKTEDAIRLEINRVIFTLLPGPVYEIFTLPGLNYVDSIQLASKV